jgi:hypothetical protein
MSTAHINVFVGFIDFALNILPFQPSRVSKGKVFAIRLFDALERRLNQNPDTAIGNAISCQAFGNATTPRRKHECGTPTRIGGGASKLKGNMSWVASVPSIYTVVD